MGNTYKTKNARSLKQSIMALQKEIRVLVNQVEALESGKQDAKYTSEQIRRIEDNLEICIERYNELIKSVLIYAKAKIMEEHNEYEETQKIDPLYKIVQVKGTKLSEKYLSIDGEPVNAETFINMMLERIGITEQDIRDEKNIEDRVSNAIKTHKMAPKKNVYKAMKSISKFDKYMNKTFNNNEEEEREDKE